MKYLVWLTCFLSINAYALHCPHVEIVKKAKFYWAKPTSTENVWEVSSNYFLITPDAEWNAKFIFVTQHTNPNDVLRQAKNEIYWILRSHMRDAQPTGEDKVYCEYSGIRNHTDRLQAWGHLVLD